MSASPMSLPACSSMKPTARRTVRGVTRPRSGAAAPNASSAGFGNVSTSTATRLRSTAARDSGLAITSSLPRTSRRRCATVARHSAARAADTGRLRSNGTDGASKPVSSAAIRATATGASRTISTSSRTDATSMSPPEPNSRTSPGRARSSSRREAMRRSPSSAWATTTASTAREEALDGGAVGDALDREPVRGHPVVLEVEARRLVHARQPQRVLAVDAAQEGVRVFGVGRREASPPRRGHRGGRPYGHGLARRAQPPGSAALIDRLRDRFRRRPLAEGRQLRPDRLAVAVEQHAPRAAQPGHRPQAVPGRRIRDGGVRQWSAPPVADRHPQPGTVEDQAQPDRRPRVHDGVGDQLGDDRRDVLPLRDPPPVAGVAQDLAGPVHRQQLRGQVDAAGQAGRADPDEGCGVVHGAGERDRVGHAAGPQPVGAVRVGAEQHQPGEGPAARGRDGGDEQLGRRRPVQVQVGQVQQDRDAVGEQLDQAVAQLGHGGRHHPPVRRDHRQPRRAQRRPQLDTVRVDHRCHSSLPTGRGGRHTRCWTT